MENNREMITLRAYRPFVTILNVFNRDNFRGSNSLDKNHNWRILIRNICRALSVAIVIVNYVCPFLLTELWVFVRSNYDLKASGLQFSYFIGGWPATYVHFLLMYKIDNIKDTLDYLQRIVSERESTA